MAGLKFCVNLFYELFGFGIRKIENLIKNAIVEIFAC